jgi:hypothetical protein
MMRVDITTAFYVTARSHWNSTVRFANLIRSQFSRALVAELVRVRGFSGENSPKSHDFGYDFQRDYFRDPEREALAEADSWAICS